MMYGDGQGLFLEDSRNLAFILFVLTEQRVKKTGRVITAQKYSSIV